jgi:putative sugar O-methyltransferase
VASIRAIHAIYQAWRLLEITKDVPSPKVVEIGGGLGHTCYYAMQLGISDYTIVDIPMTSAAQAYFLGVTLGTDLSLYGEAPDAAVRLVSPDTFFDAAREYDIALNVDSFPELQEETAFRYIEAVSKQSPTLLSINHELLPVRVSELALKFHPISYDRFPYWMRRGYIEEIFRWKRI